MPRCDHCQLEFPEREAVRDEVGGVARVFCCTGCRGVFRLILAEGLEGFYAGRRWSEPGLAADPEQVVDAAIFRGAVREVGDLAELDLYVDGIRCASCVWLNERLLSSLEGVRFARVNYATHRARVRWEPAVTPLETVLGRIRSAGYDPKPYSESERMRAQAAETRDLLIRLGTAFFLSSQLMIYSVALYAGYFQGIEPGIRRAMELIALGLALPVFLYAGAPFLRSAARGLRVLRFNMDSLVVLGSGAALAYSVYQMTRGGEVYFDTAAMIVTLVLAGRYVEARARGRASEAVARLGALLPSHAAVVSTGDGDERRGTAVPARRVRRVPLGAIRCGDLVEVAPGERVPLDGVVVEGESEVDEAMVTGEARPVTKAPGATMIGGTVNLHGAFTFRVTRTGDDTVLSGIVRAVERAQEQKPRIQAFADRVTGVFVPAVLVVAAGAVALHLARGAPPQQALMVGVAVAVIACPCSLGLATPIAVLLATGAAGARGLLVKSVDVLERAASATDVVLDKTGTLTRGRPVLREVVPASARWSREEVIALAAAVERRSEHALARPILEAARALPSAPPPATGFRVSPGQGVTGNVDGVRVAVGSAKLLSSLGIVVPGMLAARAGNAEAEGASVVYVAVGGDTAAQVVVSDVLRDEAREAVSQLRAMRLRLAVVSGDALATTAAITAQACAGDEETSKAKAEDGGTEAGEAGAGDRVEDGDRGSVRVLGGISPEGKALEIARLHESGASVVAVGDGINDAPALTQASVGVAMGRGTDVTLESADAVLVRDDLRLVPDLVRLGCRTRQIIRQNVFWAFFYNVIAIPLAVTGMLHPIVAAGAMAASSLFVVGNSLRVRSWTSGS